MTNNKRKLVFLLFAALVNVLVFGWMVSSRLVTKTWQITLIRERQAPELSETRFSSTNSISVRHVDIDVTKCPDILSGMTTGRWKTRPLTREEEASIDSYLKDERVAYRIPSTYQRPDGKCGNVNYPNAPQYKHMWFKAICDPKGQTPCCLTDRCVSLPEDQCRCPTCYDERQAIHAEYANWTSHDPRCQVTQFNNTQACEVLRGKTLHFVGDSFIRHVYAALVIVLTGNKVDGALKRTAHPVKKARCKGMHQITGLTCRELLDEKRTLCGGTVDVRYTQVFPSTEFRLTPPLLHSLRHVNNSLLIMGIGIHDNFNTDSVARRFLLPFLNLHEKLSTNTSMNVTLDDVVTNFGNLNFSSLTDGVLQNSSAQPVSSLFEYLLQYDPDQILKALGISYPLQGDGDFGGNFGAFQRKSASQILKALNIEPNWLQKLGNKSYETPTNTTVSPDKDPPAFQSLMFKGNRSVPPEDRQVKFTNSTVLFHLLPSEGVEPHRRWPRLLWMGTHAPGLLKSPHFAAQTAGGVQKFNKGIQTILRTWKVPYLDTFAFSNGTVSFDGTHYGWGVNMLKVDMLLTYIREHLFSIHVS
ncbi:uncharacterized protein LOC101857899 [Aplysia californica]|uniref:Uncharacterized protein LOC101857899 n=1 Tax=Aplysia californica TaxID=6500 RepID=A0ABM1A8G5_APLCA|nr:uncharacterized protein LOC101857899 [Aplysia californica]